MLETNIQSTSSQTQSNLPARPSPAIPVNNKPLQLNLPPVSAAKVVRLPRRSTIKETLPRTQSKKQPIKPPTLTQSNMANLNFDNGSMSSTSYKSLNYNSNNINRLDTFNSKNNSNYLYSRNNSSRRYTRKSGSSTNMPAQDLPPSSYYNNFNISGGAGQAGINVTRQTGIIKLLDFIRNYRQPMNPAVKEHFTNVLNARLNGESQVIDNLCTNARMQGKQFSIEMGEIAESEILQDFLDNFNDMKQDYFAKCDNIIDMIKNELLTVTQTNKTEQTDTNTINKIIYSFQKINSSQLQHLQNRTRTLLLDMYIKNHQYYLNGIKLLANYYSGKLKAGS